ncbi:hypothetical protein Tco_1474385 [Tanacetum coccineum]
MIQHEFITLTLAQFGQILKIPYNGQAVFKNEWDLESLEYSRETERPYCTDIPTPDDIRRLLELERVMVDRTIKSQTVSLNPNQILTKELSPDMKQWEELIRENVFGLGGHRDHLPACLAHMLYCVVTEEQYNLAYFFVKRIQCARFTPTANISYGMFLTRLYRHIMETYPHLDNGIYDIVDRARHSVSSSSSHHQGTSSHQHDDDDDDDNVQTSRATQVGDQGRGQGNGRNQNGDAINDNIRGDVRNVIKNNDHRGCTYKEFLACNPKEYDGKGGAVVYTCWIEKMESVQDMSGCGDNQKVKYTAGSFVGMSWDNFKVLMREQVYPNNEMQKLETELWNHTMVKAGHAAYTNRFHELANHGKIEESKNLSTLSFDELIGNLKVYEEVIIGKILKPSKAKENKVDILPLQAKKVSCDEDLPQPTDSEDEKYAMRRKRLQENSLKEEDAFIKSRLSNSKGRLVEDLRVIADDDEEENRTNDEKLSYG